MHSLSDLLSSEDGHDIVINVHCGLTILEKKNVRELH